MGRRINDEVEMFEDGMGEVRSLIVSPGDRCGCYFPAVGSPLKDSSADGGLICLQEYTELRKDLERHGLTVRPYITSPEIASTKFPSPTYKAITGEGENTLMARCMRTLRDSVSKTNDGEGIVTGLLADLPGRRAKSLAILRVPDEDMNKETVTFRAPLDENETVMNVVGRIDDGEIKLEVPDEEFKKYFNSLGGFAKTSLVPFIDVRAERERLEKEAAKRKKKEAKKHRRNATASTVAAASLGSETATTMTGDTPSLGGEEMDEEARRANKREKDKKKRKAKAERLRIAAADGKRVAEDVVEMFRRQHHETAEMTKGGDETGKEETPDTNGDISYLSLSNQRPLLWVFTPNDQNESDQTSSDNPNEANQPHDPTQVAAATNDDDDRFSSLSDSSFGSTIDEEDVRRRVEVLQCNSREEFREAMKERQGRNIMVAHPDGGVGLGVELGGGEGRV